MNKTFHSVWNASKQAYVAAAETVSAKGKPSSGVKVAAVMAGLMGSLVGQVANAQTAPPPNTLPTGGQVSAGQASISQSGANMVINQSSNRASVNWQSFNVGKDAHVQFQQPSAASVTLNRVMSADPSQIFGRITANGQVVLSNPAGVYFGKDARVDVGGILASTHGMSDADFMAGKNRLERNGSSGKVVNEGEIKAALGGYIALLAPEVRNQGAVIAHMGTVALAAGEAFDLKFDSNNRLTSLRVEASQIKALVDNRLAVQAPGGLVIISAQSMDRLVGGVVNNSGTVEATGLQQQGGRMVLSGSTRVQNTGTLDASSAAGKGGNISLQGDSIELQSSSRISATGPAGGGTVLVGGNWQGSADPLLQATAQPTAAATTVSMASGASIDASATQNGDGGTVVLWSDIKKDGGSTAFAGQIQVQGGANSGQGGHVETSGHTLRVAETAGVNTLAPKGNAGQWLLDPIDFTISAGSGAQTTSGIGATTLEGNLLTTNVAIATDASTAGNGDIIVDAAVTQAAANSLTLTAHGNIAVNAAISIGGNVTFNAATVTGSGGIALANSRALSVTQSGNSTYSGIVSGTGSTLTKLGAGTLTLTGANSYTGVTTISAGTLQVGDGGTTGTPGSGAIVNNAALSFNRSNALHVANVISGSGSLTKLGAGTLILAGASSYTGTTTIGAGAVRLAAAGNGTNSPLGTVDGGTVVESGATLDLYGNSLSTAEPLSITGSGDGTTGRLGALVNYFGTSVTYSGLLSLGGNATIFPSSGSINLSNTGTITGSGHTLTLTGQSINNQLAGILALGSGGVTTNYNGSTYAWTLSGANTYTGPTTLNGGTLKTTHSSALGNGSAVTISLNTSALLDISGGALTIGSLASSSSGLSSVVALGSNTLTIGSNNTSTAFAGVISGAGGVTKVGTGTLTLSGANSYTGSTTISAGTLQVGAGGSFGTLGSGAVTNDSALTFNRSNALSMANVISGSGSLTKLGAGTLTLSGANSYSGTTTISAGALRLGAAGDGTNSPLGTVAAGTVVASGGTLDLNGFSLSTAEPLSITGAGSGAVGQVGALVNATSTSVTYSGLLSLGGSATIHPYGGSINLSNTGTITGSGHTLTLNGQSINNQLAGILALGSGGVTTPFTGSTYAWTLSGANTYTGPTTIDAGTLKTTHSSALGIGSAVTLASNNSAVLDISGSNLTIGSLASLPGANSVVLGSNTLTIGTNNTSTTFAGVISGAGGVTKVGTGTLTLSGTNTFTGSTTVSAGTLVRGNAAALGTTDAGTTVASGATLNVGGFVVGGAEALTINGGTLAASTGTISLSGTVLLGADSTVNVAGTELTLSGVVSGTGFGFTKTGTGRLVLSGNNTYTGTTTISAGTLRLGAAGDATNTPLGTAAAGTLVASGATLDLNGFTLGTAEALTINGTGLSSAGALTNSSATAASYSGLLSLGSNSTIKASNGDIVLSNTGTITGSGFNLTLDGTSTASSLASIVGTGAGALTKSGAGTWTLTGDNTYTGATTITAGTLQVGSGSTTGTLGSGAVVNDAALTFNRSDNLTVANAISGSGTLTQLGAGTLTLTATNSYSGVTTISAGTLQVGSGSTTGTLGSGAVTNNAALRFNRSDNLTAANAISGNGSLTKQGTGMLILTGANTYTGTTTISAGTLRVGDGGTTGTLGSGAVTNNVALSFNRSDNLTVANNISGNGSLTKLGAGTLTLSGVSSYIGATTITSGGLVFSNDTRPSTTGFTGAGQLTIEPSTSFSAAFSSGSYTYANTLTGLTLGKSGNTSDITVGSAISVAGPVTVASAGLITLSAGITSAATSGTGISLTGQKINQNGNGVVVQTAGANISYTATNVAQTSSGDTGIRVVGTDQNSTPASINAGGGNINLNASFASTGVGGGADYAIRLSTADLVTSGSGSITLTGNASNVLTSSTPYGVGLDNSRLIAGSGGLSVNYSGNVTSTTSYGIFITAGNRASQLLAPSGDISLIDQTSSGRTTGYHYSHYFAATTLRPNIGAAAASAVTTSSANLTIQGDTSGILGAPIVNTTGAFVVEPVRPSFTGVLYTSQFSNISTPSSVRWGKAGNTSNIIVNTALNAAGSISLYGGDLTLQAALQAGLSTPSSTLTLQATNSITHNTTGFVSAPSLLLGGGNVTLTHTSNNITTLAASSVGNLTFFNSGGMTIGTVGATSGVSGTGTISLATNAGNLTLASNLSTTNATSNAILINAGRLTLAGTNTDGDLIVSGSPVLTAGTGGTIRLMTGSLSGSTGLESLVGTGSGRFRYNSDETTTRYTTALSANVVNAIYREQPAVSVTGSSNVTITYGDSLTLSGNATGTVNGDTLTMTVANPQLSTAGLLRYSATPYSASSNLGALGYNVSGLSSTVTVNRKALTLSGLSSANKTYDGLTTATVSGTAALQSAIAAASGVSSDGRRITGDTVSVTGTATGTFNSKDVASATTVSFSGLSLSGADSANYTLTPASASYSITPKALSITSPSIASKVYNGSTAAGAVTVGTLSGLVTGETVTATGSATALSSANAASYTTTVSYTLGNGTGLASNYSLANSTNVAATIGRSTLTVRANDDAKFLTQADTANFAGVSYTGFVNGETASVLSGTPTVTRSNTASTADTYIGVLQPGGLTVGNYQYNYVNGDFTIVGSNQMLVRVNNASTTYGTAATYGLTSAAYYNGAAVVTLGSGVGSITALGNNRFTVNDGAGGSATFTVVPSGSQITSSAGQLKAGSYQLQASNVTTANAANFSNNLVMVGSQEVATKAVTASIAAAPSAKVYDGNTSMASVVPLNLSGLEASDIVSVSGVGTYASRNAGTGLAYTVNNLNLAGTDAANYHLLAGATVNGTNGTITAKAITLNPQVVTKTYDGASTYTANSTDLTAMSALLGVSGDTVSAATLAFADKNVGNNKTLTASSVTIADGNGGNNYTLTLGSNSASSITRLNSVTWVGGTTGNWFDPTNWAGGAVPDLANVANVVIPSGVTVSFGSTVVAPAQSGAVSIDGLTGAGGNLSQTAGTLSVGAGGITLGSLTQSAGSTMANSGSTTLDTFTQSGGSFTGTGNMTAGSFAQTGGSTSLLANLSVTQDFNQGSSGNVSVGGNATITDIAGGLQLGNLTSTGSLSLSSTDGAITQASGTALTAQSTSSFTATQGGQPADITLGNAGNDFAGAVSLSGSNVSIVDVNALTLGTVNTAGNLTLNSNGALNLGTSTVGGNLVANSGNGNITQTGALSVVGTTGLSAVTGSITLNSVNNNFGGVVTTAASTTSILGTNAPAPNAPPPSPPPSVDPAAEAAAEKAAAEKAAAEKAAAEKAAAEKAAAEKAAAENAAAEKAAAENAAAEKAAAEKAAAEKAAAEKAAAEKAAAEKAAAEKAAAEKAAAEKAAAEKAAAEKAAAEKAAAEKLEQERIRASDAKLVTDSLLSQVASSSQFNRVNLPNPTSSAPLVLGGATSSITSGGSAATGGTIAASGTANSSGVTVDVKGSPQQDALTMVAVSLPKGAATMGTGFSFVLPDNVRATAGEGVSVQSTRFDGSALPAWLKFDRANLRFEATAVPDGAFPMQLALSIGGQRLVLAISERTE